MRTFIFLFLLLFSCPSFVTAQKVGVVLSGGGAKGLAHIGLLKVLEEHNIPIDYIAGTSMGGVVAALYASGYSPYEIEYIALTKDFQEWVNGRFTSDYKFFFKKKEDNASLLSLKLTVDSLYQTHIRTNLINDIPLNFAMLQLFAQASANANDNFDSLMIPFRCVVADVFSQSAVALKNGSLNEAVRNTLSVPYVYPPVKNRGRFLFDGGLYNNFPVKIVEDEFKPDVIIGCNVSNKTFTEYPFENDDKLIGQLYLNILISKSDSSLLSKKGVFIQPNLKGHTAADFAQVDSLIIKGYLAASEKITEVEAKVKRRVTKRELDERRAVFIRQKSPLAFQGIDIEGVNEFQKRYVNKVFKYNEIPISLQAIKKSYYKLVADDNFETVYPTFQFDSTEKHYYFKLLVKPDRNFKLDLGGNISSRPIGSVFLGLQYNFFNTNSYTFSASFYSGRFYEGAQLKLRMDIPTRVPIFAELNFTYNHWDYFKSSQIFIENISPIFIDQSDRNVGLSLGIPFSSGGRLIAKFASFTLFDNYSNDNTFKSNDTLDNTTFNGLTYSLSYDRNTLNRKQYANQGMALILGARYNYGVERYFPGTTAISKVKERNVLNWFKLHATYEKYFRTRAIYKQGFLMEAVVSNQPFFSTYKATVLEAAAFNPLQDSRALFKDNLRAFSYGVFGLKNIISIRKNIDLRLEGYIFQPVKVITETPPQEAALSTLFKNRFFVSCATLVYNTPLGPVALSANYYDDRKPNLSLQEFGVFFHIGFMLYNKRALE